MDKNFRRRKSSKMHLNKNESVGKYDEKYILIIFILINFF